MTNLEVSTPELARVLRLGSPISAAREGFPLLGNVRLQAANGIAVLTFTDADIWLTTGIPAQADAITVTTIPATLLAKAAASIESDTTTLRVNGARVSISGGRAHFALPTLGADGFPDTGSMASMEGQKEHAIASAADLAGAIASVTYAAPPDPVMYPQAVHFAAPVTDEIALATFDGKRMALDQTHNAGAAFKPINLPLKAANTLVRLCQADPSAEVRFFATDRMAHFECGAWKMWATLARDGFPKYEQVLDTKGKPSVQFDPRAMEKALNRLAIMADGRSDGLRFSLDTDRVTLSFASEKTGEATEEVPAFYTGEPQTIGYRLSFLRDAIRQLTGDTVEMFLDRFEDRPGVFATRAILESYDPQCSSRHFVGPYAI